MKTLLIAAGIIAIAAAGILLYISRKKQQAYASIYHFGKSTTPDQLDQTWVNCPNLFGVEYNA